MLPGRCYSPSYTLCRAAFPRHEEGNRKSPFFIGSSSLPPPPVSFFPCLLHCLVATFMEGDSEWQPWLRSWILDQDYLSSNPDISKSSSPISVQNRPIWVCPYRQQLLGCVSPASCKFITAEATKDSLLLRREKSSIITGWWVYLCNLVAKTWDNGDNTLRHPLTSWKQEASISFFYAF